MKILLIRHGAYTPAHIDPEEGLSAEGKEEVGKLKEKLQAEGIKATKILSSPKKRAKETARILAGSLEVDITDLLKGGESPAEILDYISSFEGTVMLVGHNPFMEYLAIDLGRKKTFHTADYALF